MIEPLGFQVVMGDEPLPNGSGEKIRKLILSSDCFISVFTHNEKIESGKWKPPDWIHNELGMAYGFGKPIAIMIEEGTQVEGLVPEASHYLLFNRNNLGDLAPLLVRYMLNIYSTLVPEIQLSDEKRATYLAIIFELFGFYRYYYTKDYGNKILTTVAMENAFVTGRFIYFINDSFNQVLSAYQHIDELNNLISRQFVSGNNGDLIETIEEERILTLESIYKAMYSLMKLSNPDFSLTYIEFKQQLNEGIPRGTMEEKG